MWKRIFIGGLVSLLPACSAFEPRSFDPSPAHIKPDQLPGGEIPALVPQAPILPEPVPPEAPETYTVVVNEVPVKELLFALARDAQVNVDIDPEIQGVVTLNAVDETFPAILDRIAGQVDLRYEFRGDTLVIQPDRPFFRIYKINYVNMARDTRSAITIATQIATTGSGTEGGGGASAGNTGNNNSTTDVQSATSNRFWETLVGNVSAILGEEPAFAAGQGAGSLTTGNVIASPETGILSVMASQRQHEQIQHLLDNILVSANRQVLIQATIVEVSLSDQYQAGIDWSFLNSSAGIDIISTTLIGVPVGTLSSLVLDYEDVGLADEDSLSVTIKLLDEFGDIRVLSSPQLMVLNNQTAILKVVDNVIYFEVDQEISAGALGAQPVVATNTTARTIPVGIVMSVTPQINENDSIILNVRPTISRVNRFVNDPNPALTISNPIPEIQVREMESLLRLNSGQTAVLGGLMQDEVRDSTNGIPGLSKLPGVGRAFATRTREFFKTELVIFLRTTIVRNPGIDGDLRDYRTLLEQSRTGGR